MTVLQAMRLCNRGGWTCEWTGDGRVCIYLWRYDQREYADSFVEAVGFKGVGAGRLWWSASIGGESVAESSRPTNGEHVPIMGNFARLIHASVQPPASNYPYGLSADAGPTRESVYVRRPGLIRKSHPSPTVLEPSQCCPK